MKKIKIIALCSALAFGTATAITCSAIGSHSLMAESESQETSLSVESSEEIVAPIEKTTKDEVGEFIEKFFSPDKVAMYCSWAAYVSTIIVLAFKFTKLKSSTNNTLGKIKEEICEEVKKELNIDVQEELKNYLPSIVSTQEEIQKVMTIFAKILALSQENTPESRVAILNLIEELGSISKETIENSKNIVVEAEHLAEEKQEEIEEKIEEIIEKYDGTSL